MVSRRCCQTPGRLPRSPAARTPPPYNRWHWRCVAANTDTLHMWCSIWPKAFRFKSSVHITDCAIFRVQRSVTHFGIDVFSHQGDSVIILLIDTAPAADQLPHVRQHGGWALGLHLVHRDHVHSWQTHRQEKKWEAEEVQNRSHMTELLCTGSDKMGSLSVSSFCLKWRMHCSVSHVWGNQSSPLGKRELLDKASDQHNIRCGVGRPEIVGVLTVMMNELSDSSPEKCVCFSGSHWLILRLK